MPNLSNADKGMGSNHQESVRCPSGQEGFSLMELLVTTAIFSILLAGVFGAYFSQLDHSTREYKVAESEIELGIAKRIIEQDLEMAGYGLADDYNGALDSGGAAIDPRPLTLVNGTGTNLVDGRDQLYLRGTALGQFNRASQGWSYVATDPPNPTLKNWGDPREKVSNDDRIVLIDPSSKSLQVDTGGGWLFKYTDNGTSTDIVHADGSAVADGVEKNTLVYGLYNSNTHDITARPYYTVRYYLGGSSPSICAPGTLSLERMESVNRELPTSPQDQATPLLACVLDFQMAVGLDTDGNGMVDNWDDDNSIVSGLTRENMNDQLKRIKVFLLIQSGNRDSDYTYPLSTIRVGEGTTIGRDITLTAEQRKYRWRLVSLSVQPRNVR
jgi:prepilin-type N-terminal cleavage/methylation domain-containing protein